MININRSNEVKMLRDRLNLSQDELADYLGVAGQVVVSRWEIGIRSPNEPLRRLFSWLCKIPKEEARDVLKKLGKQKID